MLEVGFASESYTVGEGEGSVLLCLQADVSLTDIPIPVMVTTEDREAVGKSGSQVVHGGCIAGTENSVGDG